MSKFNVNVGKGKKPPSGADGGQKAPRERKVIHPGIESLVNPNQVRCRKCGSYFEWAPSEIRPLLAGPCQCGIWYFEPEKLLVRFVRWSSMPFYMGETELFAQER